MIGQTISHYRIVAKLGEGGMGVVYKAHDTRLDRDVALKFLPASLHPSPEELQRFEQEARAISALNHANIATIYDVDEYEGQKYLVLECIPGGTLKSKLKQLKSEDKEFSISNVVDYGIQIAKGMAHAHQHGIIHRDVKTDNIMLMEDGTVKLTDFGLAKLRGDIRITKTGSTVGTAAYMSPEQVRGEEVDSRSDIFSLGVVLYELVTTHLPFRGEFETAIGYSILNESPPPLRTLRKDAPVELENIIHRCLEKDRTKRYQTADEVTGELKKIQQELSGVVRERHKSTMLWWIAAAGMVVLSALGIYLFIHPSKPTPPVNKTIAVLPFTNLSGNQEDEYFTDGIMEDILTQLSKIGELNVISRTTMMQYKGMKKSLRDIGNEVHASAVLEGSARRSGDRIRISSQLIDAETDKHLWAETYDREMKDVFAIQSDVAQKIASALKVKLTEREKGYVEKPPTDNTEAYNYYLKGREYYYRYKKEDNQEAIGLFRKAISIDRNYAIAWAGLGDAYAQQMFRYGFPQVWLDSAMDVSRKALELDNSCAEAHKSLGLVYLFQNYYDSSITANLRAIDLNPNCWSAIANVGAAYQNLGVLYKAVQWYKKIATLAPMQAAIYSDLGDVFRLVGAYERAEPYLKKGQDLQFDETDTYVAVSDFYLSLSKHQEANEMMASLVRLHPDNSIIIGRAAYVAAMTGDLLKAGEYYRQYLLLRKTSETIDDSSGGTMLAYIFMKQGDAARADKILTKEMQVAKARMGKRVQGGIPEYNLALVYSIRLQKREAYDYLRRGIQRGRIDYQTALIDPRFENIRNDVEFKKLIALMKSKCDEQRILIDQMEKEEGGNK